MSRGERVGVVCAFGSEPRAISDSERTGGAVGVLFCDADGFKGVNDRFGHEPGDRVLCEIAGHLKASVRAGDTVARIAGDEFVVVCPDATRAELDGVAARIALAPDRRLPDGSPLPRPSVGSVIAHPDDASDVMRRADTAMYEDKLQRV